MVAGDTVLIASRLQHLAAQRGLRVLQWAVPALTGTQDRPVALASRVLIERAKGSLVERPDMSFVRARWG